MVGAIFTVTSLFPWPTQLISVLVICYLVFEYFLVLKVLREIGLDHTGINPSDWCNVYCCQSKMPLLIGSFDEQNADIRYSAFIHFYHSVAF